ncbi:MAG: methyltransferase domain-containing protein [Gammaproteobacteria bacterium]|nr:methyltransferase domain-containing protein [Gammaproteobacteria bacterium]MCF6364205.1 methyltransferase domain-containing protein [Gammaproteobacteria bacterium]
MPLKKIKSMLQEVIGLYACSIGDASIERAIHHRMQALDIPVSGVRGETEYLLRIRNDRKEFDELIEEVVVPETWFFRNVFPFEALASYLPGLKQKQPGDVAAELKILSLPCSTGEEPYSIAMVMMEKNIAIGKFSIDALDVSQRAIRKAKRAIYGQHSFREEYRGLRDKYFQRARTGYILSSEVKKKVKFARANVVADNFDQSQAKYDVIFCRNLLIYFDRPTQACVLKKLHRMLKPEGVLCVGHAEAAQVTKDYFLPLDISMAFAFSKVSENSRMVSEAHSATKKAALNNAKTLNTLESTLHNLVSLVKKDQAIGHRLSRNKVQTKALAENHHKMRKNTPKTKEKNRNIVQKKECSEEASSLEKIPGYLELGRLSDATTQCEAYLKKNPESSDAYYYLGLISHQEGRSSAAESLLKKALYLDAGHHLAMGLLALLAEERNDARQAEDYRRRQKRAISRNSSADR